MSFTILLTLLTLLSPSSPSHPFNPPPTPTPPPLPLPAAVDANEFRPDPSKPWPDLAAPGAPITIVALSRLVYRKGTDILALVIPELCQRHPNVKFLIGEALQQRRGPRACWPDGGLMVPGRRARLQAARYGRWPCLGCSLQLGHATWHLAPTCWQQLAAVAS